MDTTNFYHKDGSLSSVRMRCGGLASTSYVGSTRGGSTWTMGGSSMRFSNSGRFLGASVSTGGGTTYFGRNGSASSHITAYSGEEW